MAEITLEMLDQVRDRTGVTYEEAKNALEAANGSVVDAIVNIEKSPEYTTPDIVEKIKTAVQKGNVTRIRVLRGEEELVNIPVTAGIVGGVIGLATAPWLMISAAVVGAVAKFGFDCRFQIVKEDGTVDEVGGIPKKDTAPEEPEQSEQPSEDSNG